MLWIWICCVLFYCVKQCWSFFSPTFKLSWNDITCLLNPTFNHGAVFALHKRSWICSLAWCLVRVKAVNHKKEYRHKQKSAVMDGAWMKGGDTRVITRTVAESAEKEDEQEEKEENFTRRRRCWWSKTEGWKSGERHQDKEKKTNRQKVGERSRNGTGEEFRGKTSTWETQREKEQKACFLT